MVIEDQAREDQNGNDKHDQEWDQRTAFDDQLPAQNSKHDSDCGTRIVNYTRQKSADTHNTGNEPFTEREYRIAHCRADQSKPAKCEQQTDRQGLSVFRPRANASHIGRRNRRDHSRKTSRHGNLNAIAQCGVELANEHAMRLQLRATRSTRLDMLIEQGGQAGIELSVNVSRNEISLADFSWIGTGVSNLDSH